MDNRLKLLTFCSLTMIQPIDKLPMNIPHCFRWYLPDLMANALLQVFSVVRSVTIHFQKKKTTEVKSEDPADHSISPLPLIQCCGN